MRDDAFDKGGNRGTSEKGFRIWKYLEVEQIIFADRMWDLSQSKESMMILRFLPEQLKGWQCR